MSTTAIDRIRVRYQSKLAVSEARTLAIQAKLQALDELLAEEKQIGSIPWVAASSSPVNPETRGLTSARGTI